MRACTKRFDVMMEWWRLRRPKPTKTIVNAGTLRFWCPRSNGCTKTELLMFSHTAKLILGTHLTLVETYDRKSFLPITRLGRFLYTQLSKVFCFHAHGAKNYAQHEIYKLLQYSDPVLSLSVDFFCFQDNINHTQHYHNHRPAWSASSQPQSAC